MEQYFSAPGRVELGGNHTDHQHGCVLAAAVDLEMRAAVTLAVCRRALGGQGAVRVHGGGFAGTALAFVPDDRREMFRRTVEQTLGTDKCRLLSVRNPLAHSGRYC